MKITYAGQSDIGRVRQENEDRWFADLDQGLFIVADGIGGEVAGDTAAQIVVDTLPSLLKKRTESSANGLGEKILAECLAELSNRLREESRDQLGLDGMGATAVTVLIQGQRASVGHLGDSRAYLWRDGQLDQLTKDHTMVQLLIDSGEIKTSDAATHPARGQLTRFVGMPGNPLPEVKSFDLRAGDAILLCSDGLHGLLEAHELNSIVADNTLTPGRTCKRLIDVANNAGGRDNISAVVVLVESTG